MGKQQRRTYHHGDLFDACVKAGLRQLKRSGAASLSLRKIARDAAVSPRAPYRHFKDKTDLLAALAETGFTKFKDALEAGSRACKSKDPRARIKAMAASYLGFALENPEMVQIMFGANFPNRAKRHPSLHEKALAAFGVLENEVSELFPLNRVPAKIAALHAWSLIHGFSDLVLRGQLEHLQLGPKDIDGLLTIFTDLFCHGVT